MYGDTIMAYAVVLNLSVGLSDTDINTAMHIITQQDWTTA